MCHCRIKNLNRGEIGGLNDELQNKRLIISDKDIVLDPQADHQRGGCLKIENRDRVTYNL